MEGEENVQKLNEINAESSDMDEEQQFKQEYNKEGRQLKNHHPYHGELKIKKSRPSDQDIIDLADINIREANEDILVFRKIPFHIWIAGLMVVIAALYLFWHLALG